MNKICCAIILVAAWNVASLVAAETQVFYNAKIYTADAKQSEAEAMVVQDGKIIFVGSREKALQYEGTKIDVGGKRILPGFIDTHAVNRKTDANIYPPASEYLGVKDAIDACTINAAKQLNAEKDWGSIEVGKSADFIVIDQDILTIDPKKINEIQVQQTYLRGKQVYQRKNAPYRRISAAEAKQMMQNTDKYILLDVRTKEEYEIEHIEGTLLIPDYEITNRAAAELPDKNALILIYCRSGRRSANVAHELIKMGYTNVYDFGGIIDWQYDTVRR